jgi:hypothetical protein
MILACQCGKEVKVDLYLQQDGSLIIIYTCLVCDYQEKIEVDYVCADLSNL